MKPNSDRKLIKYGMDEPGRWLSRYVYNCARHLPPYDGFPSAEMVVAVKRLRAEKRRKQWEAKRLAAGATPAPYRPRMPK